MSTVSKQLLIQFKLCCREYRREPRIPTRKNLKTKSLLLSANCCRDKILCYSKGRSQAFDSGIRLVRRHVLKVDLVHDHLHNKHQIPPFKDCTSHTLSFVRKYWLRTSFFVHSLFVQSYHKRIMWTLLKVIPVKKVQKREAMWQRETENVSKV